MVFGLSLLVPGKRRRVFRSGKENRHQKCVERYKMTKCFSNDSCRLFLRSKNILREQIDNSVYRVYIITFTLSIELRYANERNCREIYLI